MPQNITNLPKNTQDKFWNLHSTRDKTNLYRYGERSGTTKKNSAQITIIEEIVPFSSGHYDSNSVQKKFNYPYKLYNT